MGSLWCWREGGKIFEASASLLKVASLFLFLFFFFFWPFGWVLLLCGGLDLWVRYLCFFSFELQLVLFYSWLLLQLERIFSTFWKSVQQTNC